MKKIEEEEFNPKWSSGDVAHATGRALIGLIPSIGGPALEFFNLCVEDPLNKRRTAWLKALTDGLNQAGIEIERLSDESAKVDAILSVMLQSTDVALRTGDKDMHRTLIQIVLRTVAEAEPNEELLSVYLSTLRQLTFSHLRLLDLVSRRKRYEHGPELQKFEAAFMEEIRQEVPGTLVPPTRLLSDLSALHLIYSPPGSPWTSNHPNYCTMKVTEFGAGLVSYIGEVQPTASP